MILQLIPLIALCCVLQRNRKPSHPSRHVVGAVLKEREDLSLQAAVCGLLCWVCFFVVGVNHRKNDPAAGSPTATLLRLLLPLLKKYR